MMKALLTGIFGVMTAAAAMANVYTIDFTGTNDMYGLTRQTTKNENELEFVKDFSFTEEGIDFSIKAVGKDELGFALVNAGGSDDGLFIYGWLTTAKNTQSVLTLKVPNGNISGVRMDLTGYINNGNEFTFNGDIVEVSGDASNRYFAWESTEDCDEVTIEIPKTYGGRYIQTITLTYTPDLGGKKECGLAFSEPSAELIMDEEFTAPALENPNNLPITWTSSDESVATVDANGKITALSGGSTFIVASTVGNNDFAEGNARYTLTVVPVAYNLKQMAEVAPEIGDRVKVNFRSTVTYANANSAFVLDPEGNAGYFYDERNDGSTSTAASPTIYKVGQVIAGGWIAKKNNDMWSGLPQDEEEKEFVTVKYPVVKSVTKEDADRVVILENVTFDAGPTSKEKIRATTPDGGSYEFQNTYDIIGPKDAGTYDVTCVVRYAVWNSTVYFWLAPIAFADGGTAAVEAIESESSEVRYFNLQGTEVEKPEAGIYVRVANGKATKVILK